MPDGGRTVPGPDLAPDAAGAWGLGICRLGDARVAVPIGALSEVCQITALSRLLVRQPYLCGGIDLRGQLIPVIDLPAICGLPAPDALPSFAVVLRCGDRHMAFLVDQVQGISRVQPDRVQTLSEGAGVGTPACVRQVFIDAGKTVSIVDVDSLFALPGVLSVALPPKSQPSSVEDGRVPMLTFMVGGARFTVDAGDVYGTVPRQSIDVGAMTSGYCLGSITYHQRRVPVLNTVDLLGLGRRDHWAASEVVVLRCPNDRLIGLAVDAIQDIQRIDLARHGGVPGVIARQHGFLTQVIQRDDAGQVFVLSAGNLARDRGVAAIAGLSSDPVDAQGRGAGSRQGASRYLVVQAGRTFAVPLDQITSIIPIPDRLVPCHRPEKGVLGYFSRAPGSVPLVDLVALLRLAPGVSDMARVLLIGEGVEQVGFMVERVFSIEAAEWRLEGLPLPGAGAEPLVQLGSGANRKATPVLDLAQLATRHFHLPPPAAAHFVVPVPADPTALNPG